MQGCSLLKAVVIVELLNSVLPGLVALPLHDLTPCTEITVTPDARTLDCLVGVGQYLDYKDIRAITAKTTGLKYNVTITCAGGRIYLPWPFRARHVTVLNVRDCGTDGFMAEYNNFPDLPNEIEELSFQNIQSKILIKDLYAVLNNPKNISKKNECGQVNARKQQFINIDYEFGFDLASSTDMLMLDQLLSTDALKRDFLRSGGNCVFPNLEYLEESGSRSISSTHFKLIESSFYPKLREYIAANNSLARVPQELGNLELQFMPNIDKLDLSFNSISELKFIFPSMPFSNDKQLHVDLSGNLIPHLDSVSVDKLTQSNGVVFDLRENPLKCSCSLFQYGNYLIGLHSAAVLDIYYGTTCWSVENGLRKQHHLSDPFFENKFCTSVYV